MLEWESRRIANVAIVRCKGRLVAGAPCDSLAAEITRLAGDGHDIILHLGEVVFMDSSGLGLLVRLRTSSRAHKRDIRLCGLNSTVQQLVTITRLDKVLNIHSTEEAALAATYQNETSTGPSPTSQIRVLCADGSPDVLAYMRELLLREGVGVLTAQNVPDAVLLLKAATPKLVILGHSAAPEFRNRIRTQAGSLPVVELPEGFSSQDAGAAATHLLEQVRARLASSANA
jgi:anti-anti-sigma factor